MYIHSPSTPKKMAMMEYAVELLRLLRRGRPTPETNNNNAVRVEDVLRTNHWGIIRRNNASRIIILVIMILLIGFIIFLYIGSSVLADNRPHINNIDIQYTDIHFVKSNGSISLEGTLTLQVRFSTLQVRFSKTHNVKVYPLSSSYILSKIVNWNHTLTAVSTSPYRVSHREQLLVVKFVSSPLHLEAQELQDLQQSLDNGQIWLKLHGDFKMKLVLARFLVFPKAYHHIYVGCNLFFSDVRRLDKMDFRRCQTFKQPLQ